jgi:hypothetical protein
MLFRIFWWSLLLLQLPWFIVVWSVLATSSYISTEIFIISLLLTFGCSAALIYGYDRYKTGKKVNNRNAVIIFLSTMGVIVALGSIPYESLGAEAFVYLFTYFFLFIGLPLSPLFFIAVLVATRRGFVFASNERAMSHDREV